MRPETPYNPTIKTVKEFADISFGKVPAPSADDRVEPFNQLLRIHGYFTASAHTDYIPELLDRFLTRIGIQATRFSTGPYLIGREIKSPAPFYLVAKKFESVCHMHDSSLALMERHPQFSKILAAAAKAAWASALLRHVTTQSSAYRVSRYPF